MIVQNAAQACEDFYRQLETLCWDAVGKDVDLAVRGPVWSSDPTKYSLDFEWAYITPGASPPFGAPFTVYHVSRLTAGRA